MRWWPIFVLSLMASGVEAESPWSWAIANNDVASIWLLSQDDKDSLKETANESATAAVAYGSAEVLEVLVKRGADLGSFDSRGRNLLFGAAALGRLDLWNRLIKAGANPGAVDDQGYGVIHAAATAPHPEILGFLMDSRQAATLKSGLGVTPLMMAAAAGRVWAVETLLRWGAVPEDQDYLGRSVLDYARLSGDVATVTAVQAALTPWTTEDDDKAPPL